MAEVQEKTAEDVLLEDILNDLDITFEDEATKKKMRDIMQQGRARLEQIKGGVIALKKRKPRGHCFLLSAVTGDRTP